ncbi:MAG: hypothetical protein HOO96_27850 [Polyangiaceae bacterium]|nr:hypothetical protein [Polyangiaceae bacterium]
MQLDVPPASKVPVQVLANDTQLLAGGQAKRTAALSSRPPLTPMSVATSVTGESSPPPRSSRNVYIAFAVVLVLSAAGTAGVISLRGDKTSGGASSATSLSSGLPSTTATSAAVLPTVAAPSATEAPSAPPSTASATGSGRKIPGIASSAKVIATAATARPTSSAGLNEGIH